MSEIVVVNQSTTDFSKALSFSTFNSSLGTLQSVTISYTDSAVMQGFVQNTSSTSQSFTVSEESTVKLTYQSTALLTNNLIASQSYTSLGTQQSASFGTDTPSGMAASGPISSGPLFNAFLQPASNVILNLGTLTSTGVVGGGGNINTGIYTTAGAQITVTFDFTPFVAVPEPGSMALTSIGGLILVAARFRKRRAS